MTIIWNKAPQGTEEWKAARRGAITGSRAKDARDFLKPTKAELAAGLTRGASSAKREGYAFDLARERVGGLVLEGYTSPEMKLGTQEEPKARVWCEDATGLMILQAGFAHTEDRKFGVSVDGLIEHDGVWENKVMVSSATLFRARVGGDISEYVDQCEFALWLLRRQWVMLQLYVWDLPRLTKIIRIERDEARIQALEDDMVAFDALVCKYEAQLRAEMGGDAAHDGSPGADQPDAPDGAALSMPKEAVAPAEIPQPTF